MANTSTKTPTSKSKTTKTSSTSKAKTSGKKSRIPWGLIIEIILLGLELANTLLPLPWRLIFPLVIGFWTIWIKYRDNTSLRYAALVEGFYMSINVAANLLPLYWRLGAFFILGVRSIIVRYKHKHGDGKNCYCDNPSKRKK